jgi:adenine-specific DNA glycosylase
MRDKLLEWAQRDAKNAPWRYPGDPWQVLAGLVLSDRTGSNDESVRIFVDEFPSLGAGVATAIRKASEKQTASNRKRYLRLANTARALGRRRSLDSDAWVGAAKLGDAEEGLFRTVGFGENRVLASAAMLRVATRIMGSNLDGEKKLSEGRMLVGRVIGNGPRAHELTAAVHALGRVVCRPEQPDCRRCPVNRYCQSRK